VTAPVPPPPPPPPPGDYPPAPAGPHSGGGAAPKGLSVTAMVLGIAGLVLVVCAFFFPYLGMLLGLVAIVVGLVARGKAKRGEVSGPGMALTGVITGAVALVIGIAIIAGVAAFLNSDTGDCLQKAGGDQKKAEKCLTD
jgi:membrane-bound ClpP family serine protease